MSHPTTTDQLETSSYQNNPFFVAIDGIESLFNKAKSVGIFLAIICALSLLTSLPNQLFSPRTESGQQQTASQQNSENNSSQIAAPAAQSDTSRINSEPQNFLSNIPSWAWLIVVGVVLAIVAFSLFIAIVFRGIIDFSAAQMARGTDVTLGNALRGVLSQFWPYTWVLVISSVKIFLWTLLLIIPGVIASVRYSLAGVSFFEKGTRGNEAIKDSLALTKGAFLTTYASQTLFNIITLGFIAPLLDPGTNSVLYRQYRPITDAGELKPKAHVLSWLTLLFIITIVIIILAATALLLVTFANLYSTAP